MCCLSRTEVGRLGKKDKLEQHLRKQHHADNNNNNPILTSPKAIMSRSESWRKNLA